MNDLLNPAKRIPRRPRSTRTSFSTYVRDLRRPVGERLVGFTCARGPSRCLPQATSATSATRTLSSIWSRQAETDGTGARLAAVLPAAEARKLAAEMQEIGRVIVSDPDRMVEVVRSACPHPGLVAGLFVGSAEIENDGHRFGEDLSTPTSTR